ncbi:MAG: hypothetical protein LBP91_00665 [Coriobacteriales bacterium]|jgi:hypothetical protein|nr:hypothetical protein [Coriobacteriales bacterium]
MKIRLWLARIALFAVFAVNLYCAAVFIVFPQNYLHAYQLSGAEGMAAIQGIGVAFLMWNVTYPLVIVRPDKHRALYLVVLIQQAVGIIGESFILINLPATYETLAGNLTRFIIFDACALVVLLAGFFLSRGFFQHHRRGGENP